jgi:hypothetical protein
MTVNCGLIGDLMGTIGRLFPLTDNTNDTAVDQVQQQHLFISKLTVIMAETPKVLKKLNIFHDYCWTWKLKVNIDNTNIVCFTNGRLPQNLQFTYSNSH